MVWMQPDELSNDPSTEFLRENTSLPLDIIPAECIYSMSYIAKASILTYLDEFFTGALGPWGGQYGPEGPSQIRAFNDSYASFASVNQTFANIAEALTMRVRIHGEPKASDTARQIIDKPALGLVFEEKTCVQVRWAFLAFPAALVILTTTFLVVVVSQSARTSAVTTGWKSSLLSMVFHGFSMDGRYPENGDGEVGPSNLREMESVAKKAMDKLNLEEH